MKIFVENALHSSKQKKKIIVLLNDNARPLLTSITQQKILDLGWSVLLNPPYSPDLMPSFFYLFRLLQIALNDKKFSQEDQCKYLGKTSFVRNQLDFTWDKSKSNQINVKRCLKKMATIQLIEIYTLLYYSWINHIFRWLNLTHTHAYIYIYIYICIYRHLNTWTQRK